MRLLTAVFVRAGNSSVFSTGTCVTFITLGEAVSDFKLLALVAADYNLITMSMKHYSGRFLYQIKSMVYKSIKLKLKERIYRF